MKRWFVHDEPDLLGLLAEQGRVTVAGLADLAAWANGEADRAKAVRKSEHAADDARRAVLLAVKRSFVTPVAPEEIFELSERLDRVLNEGKDLVREAELLGMKPDPPIAEMVGYVEAGVQLVVDAFAHLGKGTDAATDAADRAIHEVRRIERVYRRAMSALLDLGEVREVTGRRELYRRCSRMGDAVEHVAHCVWYAVVKQG